jgi:hypothetical protein
MRRVVESAVCASANGVAITPPGLSWPGGRRSPVNQETVFSRGGSQAVRAARRDEAALLGEVMADAFAEDPVFAWTPLKITRPRRNSKGP